MALYVRQLKLGPMENFVYLVGAQGAHELDADLHAQSFVST